ncbi:F-box only protein 44-like isoform X1 [Malaclemys terrapin pileata]|uniref:F-box only protein 44-like isoform X1 n=2 Tax=Malaclemys terrapin pileata TaxID=2991368 RepID=UPI0023A86F8A|nr:F-box only protein 44-like isoform X1 [Malaclemys terrapin pileata]
MIQWETCSACCVPTLSGQNVPGDSLPGLRYRLLEPWAHRKMANIGDLPKDVLVELFSLVPTRELICNCRLVCVLWRDVVNLATVWKRKCQREGFYHEKWDKTIKDWKIFYVLCSLKKNLLKNPCAEESFQSWNLDPNEGDEWKVEDLPGPHGRDFPSPHVRKYFVTSYGQCLKSQLIDLKKEGYWDQLMDEIRPDIVVKDWYAARFDCGCRYELCVKLLSADYIVLNEFCPEPVVIEQWSDAKWREISYTFCNYKAGVRHILFEHGGQDTQYWAGWYGCRVTNSSITIEPGRSP